MGRERQANAPFTGELVELDDMDVAILEADSEYVSVSHHRGHRGDSVNGLAEHQRFADDRSAGRVPEDHLLVPRHRHEAAARETPITTRDSPSQLTCHRPSSRHPK